MVTFLVLRLIDRGQVSAENCLYMPCFSVVSNAREGEGQFSSNEISNVILKYFVHYFLSLPGGNGMEFS